jgi:hypothetical protein
LLANKTRPLRPLPGTSTRRYSGTLPREAKALPPRKQKADTTAVEEPRSEKSAEALVRDALANVDAKQAPADALIGSGLIDNPISAGGPAQAGHCAAAAT